jgi:general secretion pathway protein A
MGQGDFGFGAQPFEDAPDPRFFFPSAHAEPLCRGILSAAHQATGVVLLIGAAGSGKSMLLRRVESELRRCSGTVAVYLPCRPPLAFEEIIEACCDGPGVPGKGEGGEERRRVLADRILARSARGVVTAVLVDGAERLSGEVLAKLIELSQFGKKGKKLLQVVVAGRPELERNPAYTTLQAKAKGLVFRCHLAPLQDDEVGPFIHHRLTVADRDGDVTFSPAAVERIAELARGNPQAIVAACRQACAVARRRRTFDVSREIVDEATAADAAAPVMLDRLAGASRHVRRRLVGGARLWLALSLALAAGGGIVAVELAKDAGPSAPAPGSAVSRPIPPR